MSKGSGGPSTNYSDVRTTTSNLPEYAEPYYRDLLARTGFATSLPYESYGGQRLAYFSPMEQEAMARTGELGVSGDNASLLQAGRIASDIGNASINTGARSTYRAIAPGVDYTATQRDPGYTAGSRQVGFSPGSIADPNVISRYMNPYYQNVVDITKREASRQADKRNSGIGLEAAGVGSLGGYREAIMRSENERNLIQNMTDIQERGSQAAYLNAQQGFEADRSARAQLESFGQAQFGVNEAARQAQEKFGQQQFGLNAGNEQFRANLEFQQYRAYEDARAEASRLGLSASQINQAGEIAALEARTRAAGMLGDFANQQQGMELERLRAMQQAGLAERGLLQEGLSMGYEDFLRQQAYPREQLGFYNSILQGLPIQPGSTVASYGPRPSTTQQILGAGIGGLGLYNALGGQGG